MGDFENFAGNINVTEKAEEVLKKKGMTEDEKELMIRNQELYQKIKKLEEDVKKKDKQIAQLKDKLSAFTSHQGKGKKAKKLRYSDEKLKELYQSGMSINDLAELCKVSRNTVSKRISGKIKAQK